MRNSVELQRGGSVFAVTFKQRYFVRNFETFRNFKILYKQRYLNLTAKLTHPANFNALVTYGGKL